MKYFISFDQLVFYFKHFPWKNSTTVECLVVVSISSVAEWLISEVPPGGNIGFDPFCFSLSEFLSTTWPHSSDRRSLSAFISTWKHIDGAARRRRLFTRDWFCSVCVFPSDTQENYAVSLESSERTLKSVPVNLVDEVWKDRPSVPPDSLTRLPDRVIRGSSYVFVLVCSAHTQTHTHRSLQVYLCADKYLQTGQLSKQP